MKPPKPTYPVNKENKDNSYYKESEVELSSGQINLQM
jgi:hypothetical protein